jgi:uncharacterized NAD(P)/FAD-binding protein YdhS
MATVAVVGGGFSGTLTAIHLLRRQAIRVLLVERGGTFARGVAYSTRQPGHRLNVRAANMSAFPDQPAHFADWLTAQARGEPTGFASRGRYGDYLTTLLAEAERDNPGQLRRCAGDVTEIARTDHGLRLALDTGETLEAGAAVLALGNLPPHDPPGLSGLDLPPDVYVADPWGQDCAEDLQPDDRVAIIGTGLTMVDVVLQLRAAGFGGRVTALSRRGLLPRAHADDAVMLATGSDVDEGRPTDLSRLLHATRARAEAIGWRQAVDELRPVTQKLWLEAPLSVRARFLRHLRPWWDVHRHRLAPSVAAEMEAALRAGTLAVEAGRLLARKPVEEGVELSWRRRDDGTVHHRRFRRVVNCTGPSGDLSRTREPLLRLLAAAGAVRPDALRLGIDVSDKGQAIDAAGRPDPRLFVVGPMSRGAFWEIVAVPDIRVQVRDVAAHVAAAVTAG